MIKQWRKDETEREENKPSLAVLSLERETNSQSVKEDVVVKSDSALGSDVNTSIKPSRKTVLPAKLMTFASGPRAGRMGSRKPRLP